MRLIDADALAELLKREAEHHEADGLLERSYGVLDAYMDVLQAPTVRTEPPKMGKWIPFGSLDLDGNQQYNCSLCHCLEVHAPAAKVSYCWNCGARMEDEDGKSMDLY